LTVLRVLDNLYILSAVIYNKSYINNKSYLIFSTACR